MLASDVASAHRYYYHRYPRYRSGYSYGYSYGYATASVAPVISPVSWYIGLGGMGVNVMSQEGGPEPLENGGGATLFLGVRLSRMFGLEVSWLGSFHNPTQDKWLGDGEDFITLEGFTADARLHFAGCANLAGCLDPYLTGGVGLYALGSDRLGLDSVGAGFQVGGGFDYWISQSFTIGVRARYHGIAMGPPDAQEADVFLHTASVDGNIAFHF